MKSKKNKTWLQKFQDFRLFSRWDYWDILVFIFFLLFTLAGILVSVNRYFQYDVYYYDFGIFDQAIWHVAHFQPPIIEHYVVGGKWIFADHLNPSLMLLAPLFWFTSSSIVLLIAQAVVVGVSGVVIYLTGVKVLGNKLWAFAILTCFYLFVGVQNAVITDIHEVTFMALPLAVVFWAAVSKRKVWYFISLLLMLGFKESTFTLGVGIGIALFFLLKDWRKIAAATIAISMLWGVLAIKVIIPFFSGGSYDYVPTLPSTLTGQFLAFFDNPIKIHTLWVSFASFGFLSLFSPEFWLLILQDLAQRFLPANTVTRWGLGLHYSIQLAPIMAVAAIFTLQKARKYIPKKYLSLFCVVLILNALFFYRVVTHAPFALAYNNAFYQHSNDFAFLNTLVKKIPENASVMAQNNIAVRFDHRKMYLLRTDYEKFMPEYILIDNRPGQNPNDFFGAGDISQLLVKLKSDKQYSILYHQADQYIFKKVR